MAKKYEQKIQKGYTDCKYLKDWFILSVGEDMEKLELCYSVDGNLKWCNHFGK